MSLALRHLWALPGTLLGLLLAALGGWGWAGVVGEERALTFVQRPGWPLSWVLRHYSATLGAVVVFLTPTDRFNEALIRHEVTHVRQHLRWGPLQFPVHLALIIAAVLRGGHPYHDNAFEQEARRAERS